MGVNYIYVHAAFGVQQIGKDPLDELMIVNRVIIHAESAITGRMELATIDVIASERATAAVIGSAICNAEDHAAATKGMKQHLK